MSSTRAKILETARTLFNQYGYSNVTIRMIAQELGMSSGNLNYHFKKREHILESLYFEMVERFDQRIEGLHKKEYNIAIIQSEIEVSMRRMVEYSFIWTDLFFLLKQNESMFTHFKAVYAKRRDGYLFLFKYLNQKGLMIELKNKDESKMLAEKMILISNTWLFHSNVYKLDIDDDYIRENSILLLSMMKPYLTELGLLQYNELK